MSSTLSLTMQNVATGTRWVTQKIYSWLSDSHKTWTGQRLKLSEGHFWKQKIQPDWKQQCYFQFEEVGLKCKAFFFFFWRIMKSWEYLNKPATTTNLLSINLLIIFLAKWSFCLKKVKKKRVINSHYKAVVSSTTKRYSVQYYIRQKKQQQSLTLEKMLPKNVWCFCLKK